jgi:hypothetical protein
MVFQKHDMIQQCYPALPLESGPQCKPTTL